MKDAEFNIGHAAMMINAFATNNFSELRIAGTYKHTYIHINIHTPTPTLTPTP